MPLARTTRSLPRVPAWLAALLLLAPATVALGVEAQEIDDLQEELRVATARLEYALEKSEHLGYPIGAEDRRQRRDITARGKQLMKQAATVAPNNTEGVKDIIDAMVSLKDEANAYLGRITPLWQEKKQPAYSGMYRSAYVEVLKFHEAAADARSVSPTLSEAERAHVEEIIQNGEDTIADIKEVRESDHEARDEDVRSLMKVRQELQEIYQRGQTDRTRGFPFVSLRRSHQAWTDVSYRESGFEALRTRFLEPSSAYVTVRNDSEDRRPLFVEVEFHDAVGERTGGGTFETAELEELKPGEVREVLVPVAASHPQFWDVTRGYSLSLN